MSFSTDTVVSERPYQDVIAINDISDLLELEAIRRRRHAAENEKYNHHGWIEDLANDRNPHRTSNLFNNHWAPGGEPAAKGSQTGVLDANVYATKKTIAQGLLDVALLTANASQLKYLLQVGKEHEFYYVMMTLISLSIILQVSIGFLLCIKERFDINDERQHRMLNVLNDLAVWLIFFSVTVHVFVSVFVEEHHLPYQAKYRSQSNYTSTH
ncbi:ninjurin-2-like isoform X3 [Stegodyphus dumicola]|uniref:ninjurin-2-like isoform X3 n=1 Tax=Stegodyphus dumicola TaxID=202533 RepID=UPI0015ACCB25|nr:ninjurin-2-like isoform X3 [Stegodyphus dumicola]